MDEMEIRSSVAEILEVRPEDLLESTELETFSSYDSTARLSLMVVLSDLTGRNIEPRALQELRTYGDIVRLAERNS